jgi:hypothetical protein
MWRIAQPPPTHLGEIATAHWMADGFVAAYITTRMKDLTASKRRHPNALQQRRLKAADLQLFLKQYARPKMAAKANDRRYSRDVERRMRRLRPEDLDGLLRDEE